MSNFLQDYRTYCSNLEVPPSFTTFASLTTIAALTKRRVWTYKGDYIRIYPNLFTILVGPPGCGKTTAMEISEDVLRHNNIALSAESVTREKMIIDIQQQEVVLDHMPPDDKYRVVSPYMVFATELSELFGAGGIGMVSFLTDIFSRNLYEARTKNKGSTYIRGPFLNILAGTTPDWITNYLKDDIISGGFSRRCLFVYETSRIDGEARPKIKPEMREAWARVIARSAAISQLKGPFKWTAGAEKFFDAWYPTRRTGKDLSLLGYYETKDIQLIKVAMLVSISEGDDLVLDEHHFHAGLQLLGLAEHNLSRVFQGIGRNELNHIAVKAMDLLLSSPKLPFRDKRPDGEVYTFHARAMPKKRLDAFMFKEARGMDIKEIIEHLKSTDKIESVIVGTGVDAREVIIVKQDREHS